MDAAIDFVVLVILKLLSSLLSGIVFKSLVKPSEPGVGE